MATQQVILGLQPLPSHETSRTGHLTGWFTQWKGIVQSEGALWISGQAREGPFLVFIYLPPHVPCPSVYSLRKQVGITAYKSSHFPGFPALFLTGGSQSTALEVSLIPWEKTVPEGPIKVEDMDMGHVPAHFSRVYRRYPEAL